MLFKRKSPMGWWETIRISLWPRNSWERSAKYVLKRILRLTGTPHAVAAGVAAGVLTSFTPFMGFHFIIAALFALILGGNLLASALGTFFGNPLSFPFIWAATFSTGNWILRRGVTDHELSLADALTQIKLSKFWTEGFAEGVAQIANIWDPFIKPMAVGALPVGVPIASVAYVLTRWLTLRYKEKRQKKLKNVGKTANKLRADSLGGQKP